MIGIAIEISRYISDEPQLRAKNGYSRKRQLSFHPGFSTEMMPILDQE